MRHGRTHNHLGRTNTHRSAMLSNMACSLIEHKRIETTLPKARELRRFVEPILTKAKTDSTHSRRIAFSYLQDKEIMKELFGTVAEKIANRPGGYTRIIKLGTRLGDNADLALIELVDFNELLLTEAKPEKARTRRSRRGSSAGTGAATGAATVATAGVAEASTEATAPLSEEAPAADIAEAPTADATEATSYEADAAPEAAVAEAETPAAESGDQALEAPASEEGKGEGEAGEVA